MAGMPSLGGLLFLRPIYLDTVQMARSRHWPTNRRKLARLYLRHELCSCALHPQQSFASNQNFAGVSLKVRIIQHARKRPEEWNTSRTGNTSPKAFYVTQTTMITPRTTITTKKLLSQPTTIPNPFKLLSKAYRYHLSATILRATKLNWKLPTTPSDHECHNYPATKLFAAYNNTETLNHYRTTHETHLLYTFELTPTFGQPTYCMNESNRIDTNNHLLANWHTDGTTNEMPPTSKRKRILRTLLQNTTNELEATTIARQTTVRK